jgi:hypothetical protein
LESSNFARVDRRQIGIRGFDHGTRKLQSRRERRKGGLGVTRIDTRGPHGIGDVTLERPGSRPILVRTFPAERRFADDVRRVAADASTPPCTDEVLRSRIESALRAWYPRLTIHARTDFGALDQAEILWYALRDGRVRPEEPRTDRLHAALATARDVTDEAEAALRHARETASVTSGRPSRHDDEHDVTVDGDD